MSQSEEKPIFVFRPVSRKAFFLYSLYFFAFVIVVSVFLIPDWILIALIWIVFVIFRITRFLMVYYASKERTEFYDDKFKIVIVNLKLEDASTVSQKEEVTQKTDYSEIVRIENRVFPLFSRTVLYGKGERILLTVPKTSKKKELGGLNLVDWLRTKVGQPREILVGTSKRDNIKLKVLGLFLTTLAVSFVLGLTVIFGGIGLTSYFLSSLSASARGVILVVLLFGTLAAMFLPFYFILYRGLKKIAAKRGFASIFTFFRTAE